MPVVINEFEVVAESRPAPRAGGEPATEAAETAKPLDLCAVAAALRTLEVQALRVWSH